MDAQRNGRHRRGIVAVVRRGDENHVQLLGVLFEHLSPIGIARRFLPAVPLQHAAPTRPVDLGEADAVEPHVVGGAGMGAGPAAHGDKADIQLLVKRVGRLALAVLPGRLAVVGLKAAGDPVAETGGSGGLKELATSSHDSDSVR